MIIVMIFTLFESVLFPDNIFAEDLFNPALIRGRPVEASFLAGTRFGMTELREYKFSFQGGAYAVGLSSLGSALYRENDISGSFSVQFREVINAGLGLHVLNCWISGNSNCYNYSLRAGGAGQIGFLLLSAWINNINQPRFSSAERVPVTYSARADYTLERGIVFSFALRSIAGNLPFYNAGIRAKFFGLLEAGIGLNTDPVLMEFTNCFRLGWLSMTYEGSSHPKLGWSHRFGVTFKL